MLRTRCLCRVLVRTLFPVAVGACTANPESALPPRSERVREPASQRSLDTRRPSLASTGTSGRRARPLLGQELYLPVYSSVHAQDEARPLEMTVTVSVRNTAATPITIERLDYYSTEGEQLEPVLKAHRNLGSLESQEWVIRASDARGGTGANFLIAWRAAEPTAPPLVQAIHVYLAASQNFAFRTDAVAIRETVPEVPKIAEGKSGPALDPK